MKLRDRTLIGIVLSIFAASIALVVIARSFYLRGFWDIEAREARDAVRRAEALILDDLDQLDLFVRDWAIWDDTYVFLGDGNSAYVDSNLGEAEMNRLGLSAFLLIAKSGATRYAARDGEALRPLLPEDLSRKAGEAGSTRNEGLLGIALVGGRIDLVSARPVYRSDGSGPSRGIIVMARPIDQIRLLRYSRLLGVTVSIAPLSPAPTAGEVALSTPRAAVDRGRDFIAASIPLDDFRGKPVASLAIRSERDTYRYGTNSLFLFLAAIIGIIGVAGLVMVMLLDATVLKRMRSIGDDLDRIAVSDDPAIRIADDGDDELAALGRIMNRTLDSLHATIREKEAMLREIHHRVKNNLQIISSLLSLQSEGVGEETSEALAETRRRVDAMSFVHQELYLEPRMDSVRFDRFLRRLVREAGEGLDPDGRIKAVVEASEIRADVDSAIPAGLIVGEIVANAYQHAFVGRARGSIRVSARPDGERACRIEIVDDGVGPGEGGEPRPSLGLNLARGLASQIGATMTIGRDAGGGTRFSLWMPSVSSARGGETES